MSTPGDDAVAPLEQVLEDPRLAGLLQGTPIGLGLLDRQLRFRALNDALADMNGLPREQHLGRTPMELLPGISADEYLPAIRSVLETGQPRSGVAVRGRTGASPGRERVWDETFYAVRNESGEILGVGVSAVDVTDRVAAQEALRQREATLRLILDSAPSGMLLVDGAGTVRALNPAAEKLFGYTREELVGRPVDVLLPVGERAEHPALRAMFMRDPQTRAMGHGRDLRARRKDGSEFAVEVGLGVTSDARDLVTCVVTDISLRKRQERERARLLAAEQDARRRLSHLQKVTEAGLSTLTLPDLLDEMLRLVLEAVGGDAAAVLLRQDDGGDLYVAGARGLQDDVHLDGVRVAAGLVEDVMIKGRPQSIPDLPADLTAGSFLSGLSSVLAAPLVVAPPALGVLVVGAREPGRLTESDLDFLQPVADRVALAADRARTFNREREIAETLQRSLLPPRMPVLRRASVAVRYLAGTAGTRVGGDWYDVLPLGEDRVALIIGDVMGRGVRAAAVMGQLRGALRVYLTLPLGLADAASRLNRDVLRMGEHAIATVLIVILDQRTGDLTWVNAGHLPMVLRDPGGNVRILDEEACVALGVLPDAAYRTFRTTLAPGGTVLLYTDGLIERPSSSLSQGLEELARTVRAAPEEPEDFCARLVESFLGDRAFADDVAMLALRLDPLALPGLRMHVPGGAESLAEVRARLRAWLGKAGATAEEVDDVLLAVGEALAAREPAEQAQPVKGRVADPVGANDVAAGVAADRGPADHSPADRTWVVDVDLVKDRVEVLLRGAPPSAPDGTDRGRGLLIMESTVNELAIANRRSSQEVRLVRTLAAPRGRGSC